MTNAKPRLALVFGILCISIFPILIKLKLAPGLISAFYRMAIAVSLLLPYVLFTKKFKLPEKFVVFYLLRMLRFGILPFKNQVQPKLRY